MASCSGARRSGCSPRSMSSSGGWRKPKSGSTSRSACSRRTATPLGSCGRTDGMEDILTVILIFGGGACIALAFSPIGRAVADRIRGKSALAGGGDLRTELAEQKDALDQELEAVRREVADLAERMDFAERLLAQNREGQRIGPGK